MNDSGLSIKCKLESDRTKSQMLVKSNIRSLPGLRIFLGGECDACSSFASYAYILRFQDDNMMKNSMAIFTHL